MSNELPEGYIEWIPRASEVVSFVFPFTGTEWERRYLQWLKKVGVEECEYLDKAQTVWTYVHQWMEDYINRDESKVVEEFHTEIVAGTINGGMEYIDKLEQQYWEERDFIAEPILLDKEERFQWSSNLVLIHKKEKKVIIIDWKSFWISKSFFSLPNKYRKPYAKIKKGQLQFSLYGETYIQKGYEVEKLILVYLHEDQAYPYELPIINSEELNLILTSFTKSLKPKNPTIIINHIITNMIVELRAPTEQYWFINVTIDMYKEKEGAVIEDKIEEAKVLINNYKLSGNNV